MSDRASTRRWRSLAVAGLLGCLLLLAFGCGNETTTPGDETTNQAGADLTGALDPTGQTFRLEILTDPPPGHQPVPIELLGSDLTVDPDAETVALDVALRNAGNLPLYAPAMVRVGRLVPAAVTVENADVTWPPEPGVPVPPFLYGFDYSLLLGDDNVLVAGETSGARTWVFHVPGLTAFSFGARASFGTVPDLPRISGACFLDLDRDGERTRNEPGIPGGVVRVVQPDGMVAEAHPNHVGGYALPVTQVGLYRLTYLPPPVPSPLPVIFTTPNPLEVILPPGPDGAPISFHRAHFGAFFAPGNDFVQPVVFSGAPPDSLRGDHYALLAAELRGHLLVLRVGFSGCDPWHPFTLFMSGGFMESSPVQANLVLQHDDLGQLCDAYFERTLRFDLQPIRARYVAEYGVPGPVQLNFIDYQGEVHEFLLSPGP